MSATRFDATATREGRWWVVDVPEIGVTQGRNATEARTMTVDLIASMLDVVPESIEVSLTFELPGDRGDEVSEARRATAEAALAQQEAATKARQTVAALKADGLSGADIAAVLDISPQRVSQLAKGSPEDDRKRHAEIREWARKRGLTIARMPRGRRISEAR